MLGEVEENIEVKRKQNSFFPAGLVISVMLYILKNRNRLHNTCLLDAGWRTNLPWFPGARPDHQRVQSSSCCFPREF